MHVTLIDRLFPLLFDTEQGGGIGDVSEIPHGHSGDVSILERGADEESDDDAGDADEGDDDGDVGDDGEGDEDDDVTPEEFGEDEDEDEGDDKGEKNEDDKGDDDKDVEVFEGRPSLTDIKKKYPKIFKEFPELREVLFREQKLSEQFGTVEEAQEAAELARGFRTIESSLIAGDPAPIFQQLAKNDPDALVKVVDNLLPTLLREAGENVYLRATVPIIETFLWNLQKHGKQSGDVNLVRSAQHAANYIFGKPEIPDPDRRKGAEGPHPAEKKLEEERKTWAETRFKEASSEINGSIDSELETEIMKGLDPEKKLTPRQRTNLIEDIKNEIDALLGKDQAFGRQMKALWRKAADADYPKDQRASIKSAFLARAKALVPGVRSRLRAEWFGEAASSGDGKQTPRDKGDKKPLKKRTLPESGRAGGGGGAKRPPKPNEVDYSKTTDEDLIAGRFTRKRQ